MTITLFNLENGESTKPKELHLALLVFGVATILFAAAFTTRIVWEETALTLQQGPQTIGFSLGHGRFALLFLAPLLLLLWLVIAFVVIALDLRRKRPVSKKYWTAFATGIFVVATLSLPTAFWQWLMIQQFAKSPHAAELMTYSAAEGNVRTVRGYLKNGVPLEAKNSEGSTAAFTAAAGGSVSMLKFLASEGADLNRVNLYGDSPLEAAVENHNDDAVAFLKAHGAVQIRGTEEQRQAASESIVRKAIQDMEPR